ncbi:MAG: LAGLIDADG family homing endonuclease [Patescibacteria group bacterium]
MIERSGKFEFDNYEWLAELAIASIMIVMPKQWSIVEKQKKLIELQKLYIKEGKTIKQIGEILRISDKTVFQRLKYFSIQTNPAFKKRRDVVIPEEYTADLAEFFGVMLGDGKLSHFQVVVSLGTKEMEYAEEVVELIHRNFKIYPKIAIRKTGYKDVYFGSVDVTSWLKEKGLVYNKVLSQVDVPKWIFDNREFMKGCIRGFFDTDGSIYRLRFGIQISFTNKSAPLLKSIQIMLVYLGYHPSRISGYKFYLTKKNEVSRFFEEINPRNQKHRGRFKEFLK